MITQTKFIKFFNPIATFIFNFIILSFSFFVIFIMNSIYLKKIILKISVRYARWTRGRRLTNLALEVNNIESYLPPQANNVKPRMQNPFLLKEMQIIKLLFISIG